VLYYIYRATARRGRRSLLRRLSRKVPRRRRKRRNGFLPPLNLISHNVLIDRQGGVAGKEGKAVTPAETLKEGAEAKEEKEERFPPTPIYIIYIYII